MMQLSLAELITEQCLHKFAKIVNQTAADDQVLSNNFKDYRMAHHQSALDVCCHGNLPGHSGLQVQVYSASQEQHMEKLLSVSMLL